MIEVNGLKFSYRGSSRQILDGVSFKLDSGTITAILGNNGAGKSTLLKCIDKIEHPESGSVIINGKNVAQMHGNELARCTAYVAQNAHRVDSTVFDAVLLGRKPYIKWDASAEDYELCHAALKKLNLEEYALRNVSTLSGGEAQKVMLARALVQEPELLLLDEPTSNLDPRNQHETLQLVQQAARENGFSVLCVLHDLNLAIRYCDRFIFMKDGKVYAFGGREVMTPEIIEEVYNMHVHVTECMGIPVIVPFPDGHMHPHVI